MKLTTPTGFLKKHNRLIGLISLLSLVVLTSTIVWPVMAAPAYQAPVDTATSTATREFSTTPYERPVIVITSYSTSPNTVTPGQDFNLDVQIYNAGETQARNIVVTFSGEDFLLRNTGGVLAVSNIFPGNHDSFTQPMTANWALVGYAYASINMTISYTDESGNAYTGAFVLSINLNVPKSVFATATSTPTVTPTPTAPPLQRPQLVITGYESDVSPLQPGLSFNLKLNIENLGNALARRVTMIVGGGTIAAGTTPEPGIPGASGEFTNFAPLGTSNVQSLGELPAGGILQASQALIVNVNTNPGAYPMKISFVYTAENGAAVIDEQVITILVYALPSVEISFYRDPGPIFSTQANLLPVQITNLGRKSAVLGNMRVSAPNGILENNAVLVGTLDSGGYYTLDATYIPDVPGPVDLTFTIDYTDDFNQPRQIIKTIPIEVLEFTPPEEPIPGEGDSGAPILNTPETFWQKIGRFFMGFIGLDSAKPTQPLDVPLEEKPVDNGATESRPLKGP